ncbi:Tryparedoxin [Diplonema papillatum]|nr:Tryparedoxin [Diplonema papillatum]
MGQEKATSLADMLGSRLLRSDGSQVPLLTALGDKDSVLLFFTAAWCAHGSTLPEKLSRLYEEQSGKRRLEIVQIGMDDTKEQHEGGFSTMPWLALPFEEHQIQAELFTRYRVLTIPSVVAVNAVDGSLCIQDASKFIDEDPTGQSFPWRRLPAGRATDLMTLHGSSFHSRANPLSPGRFSKKSWTDSSSAHRSSDPYSFLGSHLVRHGDVVAEVADVCDGRKVFLHFGAEWRRDRQSFETRLARFAKQYSAHSDDVVFVYVSVDRCRAHFEQALKRTGTYAVPFDDKLLRRRLRSAYGVVGIPSYLLVDQTGVLLVPDCRPLIDEGHAGVLKRGWARDGPSLQCCTIA